MGDARVIRTVVEMQRAADSMRASDTRVGLVPTMGYLHAGHLSLVDLARQHADSLVVSIFVNPTQFGPKEDLQAYPRDFDRDLSLLSKAGVGIVFAPSVEEMYPHGHTTAVEVGGLTGSLCGASRPGHFRGVATVVTKLLAAAKPHVAAFGQKDAQQVAVIQRLVRDLNLDVEILVGPTVREADGLAMSSRNRYLAPDERIAARAIHASLLGARGQIRAGERRAGEVLRAMQAHIEESPLASVDYVAAVSATDLAPVDPLQGEVLLAVAVRFGGARLIDNLRVGVANAPT